MHFGLTTLLHSHLNPTVKAQSKELSNEKVWKSLTNKSTLERGILNILDTLKLLLLLFLFIYFYLSRHVKVVKLFMQAWLNKCWAKVSWTFI